MLLFIWLLCRCFLGTSSNKKGLRQCAKLQDFGGVDCDYCLFSLKPKNNLFLKFCVKKVRDTESLQIYKYGITKEKYNNIGTITTYVQYKQEYN